MLAFVQGTGFKLKFGVVSKEESLWQDLCWDRATLGSRGWQYSPCSEFESVPTAVIVNREETGFMLYNSKCLFVGKIDDP